MSLYKIFRHIFKKRDDGANDAHNIWDLGTGRIGETLQKCSSEHAVQKFSRPDLPSRSWF